MFDFLTLKPQSFGLDISDLSLKIIKLEKKQVAGFNLVSFGETKVKPGIIDKGEIQDEKALIKVIENSLRNVKGERLATRHVVVSLPEEKAFLQVIHLPKMKIEEAKKAVYFEAENYIPFSIDDVYLDSQVIPSVSRANKMDVLIAALPKKTIDPYVNVLKGAGLKPLVLEIESQAITRALIKQGVTPKTLLLVDLGASRTSFIIFCDSSLRFTSSRPISSQQFTNLISQDMKINLKKAELLKIKYGIGESKDGRRIFKILLPVLNELAEQIKEYLGYCQAHHKKKIDKILLCGGGVNLKSLDKFLSVETNTPVELGDPWINILTRLSGKKRKLPDSEALRYTTALGLALRGFKYD